jgi:hypothetical protein
MKKPLLSPGLFCLAILPIAAAQAQTQVNLSATQDAFVAASHGADNFGGAGALAVAASSTGAQEQDAIIEFNLASAVTAFNTAYGAGQWSIQSITLQLFNTPPNNAIFNNPSLNGSFTLNWMESVTSTSNWTEGNGTPANQPNTSGISANGASPLSSYESGSDELLGTYSYTAATSGSNTYTLGLPSGFDASATAGNIVSFDMLPVEASGISMVVNSRTGTNPPVLAVTAVPEPATTGLFLGAVSLMGARRRRFRRVG